MTNSITKTWSIEIRRADNLPFVIFKRPPNAFVKLKVEKNSFKTAAVHETRFPEWNEKFTLPGLNVSSSLSLRVFHEGTVLTRLLGGVEMTMEGLIKLQTNEGEVILDLHADDGITSAGNLTLHLQETTLSSAAKEAVENTQGLENKLSPPTAVTALSAVGGPATDLVSKLSSNEGVTNTLTAVLSKIEVVLKITEEVAKVHPFATMAWQVFSSTYNVVKGQLDRDDHISTLIRTMEETYSFVNRIEELRKRPFFDEIVEKILKQTIECAFFIQEYAQHTFLGRAVRQLTSDWDQKISQFSDSFLELYKRFDSAATVEMALVTFRMTVTVDDIRKDQILTKLNPAVMDGSARSLCLPNTRSEIIESVTAWAVSCSDQNILWLWGLAGAGKSTIATTIADRFREFGRLGAFLFFNRDVKERNDPGAVVRTLTHQLATFHPEIRDAVSRAVQANPSVTQGPLLFQFRKLLFELLPTIESLRGTIPVVVVIDALDECGDVGSRKELLSLLFSEAYRLPTSIRILITSRPERDIRTKFTHQSHIISQEIDIASNTNAKDITEFIRFRMAEIRSDNSSLAPDWPGDTIVAELAQRAGGLFIWASTACRFIAQYPPAKHLQTIIHPTIRPGVPTPLAPLDELYMVTLDAACDRKNEYFWVDFRAILGTILVAKVPLSSESIDSLLQSQMDQPCLEVISRLESLLQIRTGVVSILHASFHDFLSDRLRCQDDIWFIDIDVHNGYLARHCVHLLDQKLKENICDLTLSSGGFVGTLPGDVTYACLFWVEHATTMKDVPPAFKDEVHDFLRKHSLHWLEAMSLIKKSRHTITLLKQLSTWTLLQFPDDQIFLDLVNELYRFSQTFADDIEEHPLLIYRSALPLTPHATSLYKRFHRADMPRIMGPNLDTWTPILLTITGHSSSVCSVAFSPDGSKIVSGSADYTAQVWDSATGALLLPPLLGHTGPIWSISFSPDATKIQSSSLDSTLRVWNANDGTEALPPLKGHGGHVWSSAFSPDGLKIVSGSSDGTIRFWDTGTGAELHRISLGQENVVWSVAFSHDGSKVVSGSNDKSIRIWDSITGTLVLPPFQGGHDEYVRSVAFSPDGSRIVSGSGDKKICVWDATTGTLVFPPLEGHESPVWSVVFSPDGSRIVSGSQDKTVRLWDITSVAPYSFPPFQDHEGSVYSVQFSPDGSKVLSSSIDKRIHVWDATSRRDTPIPPQGHSDTIYSTQFSRDGLKVVTGSKDGTARFWDPTTGTQVGPPLSHDGHVIMVAFSPDGSRVVAGLLDATLRIWDIATGMEVLPPLRGHKRYIWSVGYSSDGSKIASCAADETMHIWDANTGERLFPPLRLEDHGGLAKEICFSLDNTKVLSRSTDDSIRVWDIITGNALPVTESTVSEFPLRKAIFKIEGGWIIRVATKEVVCKVPKSMWILADSESTIVVEGARFQLLFIQLPS